MSYFKDITTFESIDDLRAAYRERTGNSMPLQVCHEMSKLMKKHGLSFRELARIIESHGGLAGSMEYLENKQA